MPTCGQIETNQTTQHAENVVKNQDHQQHDWEKAAESFPRRSHGGGSCIGKTENIQRVSELPKQEHERDQQQKGSDESGSGKNPTAWPISRLFPGEQEGAQTRQGDIDYKGSENLHDTESHTAHR